MKKSVSESSQARVNNHGELIAKAESGDSQAQYSLGFLYAFGLIGEGRNYTKALELWEKAAEQGVERARDSLRKDLPYEYYTEKAEAGDASAQFSLGWKYSEGECLPRDYVLAYKWANLAAAQSDWEAKDLRDILESKMTLEQISEAQKLAREWRAKAKEI